jgi:glycosyltransferase involved in cell wall biosynthesis
MPRFHVVTPNLTPGDAVSQDAVGMVRALNDQEQDAFLYASEIDPELAELGESIDAYEDGPAQNTEDVLIHHHCVAWGRGVDLYSRSRNRRVLKYHNVTPATFYAGIHADYVAACSAGRAHTKALLSAGADLYLGDSDFNTEEMIELGAPRHRCRTAYPFNTLDSLSTLQADVDVLRLYEGDWRNILFVGRVAPNKGHLALIDIFAHYHHQLNPHSRLFLVGTLDPRLQVYERQIRAAIDRAGLNGFVFLTGKVTPTQLKAYYLISHAFLCASEHEGFCVPLVEAMRFKIPCVALSRTAVTTTLGEGAILWDELDPGIFGESLNDCIEVPAVRGSLIEHQTARYRAQFSPAAVEQRFLKALNPLLQKSTIIFHSPVGAAV